MSRTTLHPSVRYLGLKPRWNLIAPSHGQAAVAGRRLDSFDYQGIASLNKMAGLLELADANTSEA